MSDTENSAFMLIRVTVALEAIVGKPGIHLGRNGSKS